MSEVNTDTLGGWDNITQLLKELDSEDLAELDFIIDEAHKGKVMNYGVLHTSLIFIMKSIGLETKYLHDNELGSYFEVKINEEWGQDGTFLRRETIKNLIPYYLEETTTPSSFESKIEELYHQLFSRCQTEASAGRLQYLILSNDPIFSQYSTEEINTVLNLLIEQNFYIRISENQSRNILITW
ncbi:hypothetical protein ACFC9N_11285 [Enterococcus casseliflavus]|uniref:hypothetical protein n=1 Tax=Enterococcus TaxID=1350 RepID=UPI000A3C4FC2|nr:hypothetical protein [Enterococcus sp. 4E1_DIV0656]OTO09267.1 hypothetical protein A5882_003600 [Enterococcus sp. 4E1_DIV0656]